MTTLPPLTLPLPPERDSSEYKRWLSHSFFLWMAWESEVRPLKFEKYELLDKACFDVDVWVRKPDNSIDYSNALDELLQGRLYTGPASFDFLTVVAPDKLERIVIYPYPL